MKECLLGGEFRQMPPAAQELKRNMEKLVHRSPSLAEHPSRDKGLCRRETICYDTRVKRQDKHERKQR